MKLSVALIVMGVPPALLVVGVPLITPVLALSVRPAGRVPLETVKTQDEAAPLAVMVCEYALPTVPCARLAGATVMTGQLMAKVAASVPWQPLVSVARNVTLLLICVVGVPLTTPVLAFSERPAGNVPLATAKV